MLAGGSARRLDGASKPDIAVGGRSLLDRVLDAVMDAERVIVVGPRRPTERAVRWVREDPPGTGPVAGIAAGLAAVEAARLVVLAADLPRVAPAVPVLLSALGDADVAVLTRADHSNYLAAAWRADALRAAITRLGAPSGIAARKLYDAATVVDVPDVQDWGRDCDTWKDIRRVRGELASE